MPFDLKTTMSASGRGPALAGDDLLQLVHLEPVEDAALDRLDQVARLELACSTRVAADERGALEHGVVELAARGSFAPTAHTSAPSLSHSPRSTGSSSGHGDDDVLLGRSRCDSAGSQPCSRQNAASRSAFRQ